MSTACSDAKPQHVPDVDILEHYRLLWQIQGHPVFLFVVRLGVWVRCWAVGDSSPPDTLSLTLILKYRCKNPVCRIPDSILQIYVG